jgi:hypothetical protein
MTAFAATTDRLAALLRGEPVPWSAFETALEDFLRACAERDLTGLVAERVWRSPPEHGVWPADVREALLRELRAFTATELLRANELVSVLDALAGADIHPILLKGSALAYSVYDSPAARPRVDTDLLIRRNDVITLRTVMAERGYTAPVHCDGELLFCQFPLKKTDRFGLVHAFDVHWKISTQSVFADLLRFDEIAASATHLPLLGAHARTAGSLHSLLLACVHPVMHHRNADSLIWLHDVHLLASLLTDDEFDRFSDLAIAKHVSAICAYQLTAARERLGTSIPDSVLRNLGAAVGREPSAAYLRADRGWGDELVSNLQGLRRWRDRLRLLREVALPGPAYMLKAHDMVPSRLGMAALPVLYFQRLVSGGLKILRGQK